MSQFRVLTQLTNAEIVRLNVMTRVRTQNLCEFNLSSLPLLLRQKKKCLNLFPLKNVTTYLSLVKKQCLNLFELK